LRHHLFFVKCICIVEFYIMNQNNHEGGFIGWEGVSESYEEEEQK